jgi:hypothetical protein
MVMRDSGKLVTTVSDKDDHRALSWLIESVMAFDNVFCPLEEKLKAA